MPVDVAINGSNYQIVKNKSDSYVYTCKRCQLLINDISSADLHAIIKYNDQHQLTDHPRRSLT